MSGKDHNTIANPKRRNKGSEQWVSYPIEMLESPAYRALSLSAHMVIARVAIELAHHGGNDNGKLPVTFKQFMEYGISHRSGIAPAIREAEALGFIKVTEHGRGGNADYRRPNLFYLTFANWRGSKAQPPSHDWRKIETVADAERIAAEARKAKSQALPPKRKNLFPVLESGTGAGTGKRYRNDKSPGTGIRYDSVSPESGTTSISWVGEAKRADPSPGWLKGLEWNDDWDRFYDSAPATAPEMGVAA
jgi:hypothetical protein